MAATPTSSYEPTQMSRHELTQLPSPRITVGVPTYNRSALLERALTSLVRQDARDVEVVVSDNASDDGTAEVIADFVRRYPQVRPYRHENTVSAIENFRTVLRQSNAAYFMWAADDDDWHPQLVSRLARHLDENPSTVLVAAEARYRLPDGRLLPFFPEGAAWYGRRHPKLRDRLRAVVRHNYGNLIYGMYRREVLIDGHETVLDRWHSLNEIPLYLRVAVKGDIQVLGDVLFYKTAPLSTYAEVARHNGVVLPRAALADADPAATRTTDTGQPPAMHRVASLRSLLGSRRQIVGYTYDTFVDCVRAVQEIPAPRAIRAEIGLRLMASLGRHAGRLALTRRTS